MDERDKQGRVVLLSCFFVVANPLCSLHSNALVTVSPATCSSNENDNMKVSRHGNNYYIQYVPIDILKIFITKKYEKTILGLLMMRELKKEEWEIIQINSTIINNYTHLIINVTHPLVT